FKHVVKSEDGEDTAIVIDTRNGKDHVIKKASNFYDKTALLLSALGDQHRIKILKILEESPQYQKELAEITGLKGGSFKHHTDILQEADFITREAVRGRYLITQLGIEALKLGEMIYLRKKRLEDEEEQESIDIDIED
ncbi:MAG: winged helix-turn-helix transcriptional regulator, partial [Candidatus Heimdallarchaeota archaeon]|nr:winged helix-turn-helix transcriptional regulator [Candidatus Heimdallarchaeota archaeon]MCK4876127.1 winged helix-turn-helix transcriptional regulator [Candidatus Heimdallarchaeota archaeon]